LALSLHGVQPSNVFRLIGEDENSGSFALGWVLEKSLAYRKLVVHVIFGKALDVKNMVVSLQRHRRDGGYTDVEIQDGHRFHAVLEAKRWWEVPGVKQLQRYHPRLVASGAARQRLVSVSAADVGYANKRLPSDIDGVGVVHLSWGNLRRLAMTAQTYVSGFEEKLWLRHFIWHLQEYASMERQSDNTVFVVALGKQPMVKGRPHTWIDVVEKDGRYFHPVGNNWPVQPPNYIGFRYDGKLQSVHHIDSFEVVEDLSTYNPQWLKTDFDHFVYKLGPAMRPSRDIRTGKIYMNGRVWCAIDTLLSGAFSTISDARDETKRRLAE